MDKAAECSLIGKRLREIAAEFRRDAKRCDEKKLGPWGSAITKRLVDVGFRAIDAYDILRDIERDPCASCHADEAGSLVLHAFESGLLPEIDGLPELITKIKAEKRSPRMRELPGIEIHSDPRGSRGFQIGGLLNVSEAQCVFYELCGYSRFDVPSGQWNVGQLHRIVPALQPAMLTKRDNSNQPPSRKFKCRHYAFVCGWLADQIDPSNKTDGRSTPKVEKAQQHCRRDNVPKWGEATEARNKWIYEQCLNPDVPFLTVASRLKKKPRTWARIETAAGIKKTANAYATRHNLPPIPTRQSGRRKMD